jgi:adenosylcobinamide amidohydrolase
MVAYQRHSRLGAFCSLLYSLDECVLPRHSVSDRHSSLTCALQASHSIQNFSLENYLNKERPCGINIAWIICHALAWRAN